MGKTAAKPNNGSAARRLGLDRADVVAAAVDLVVREGPAALTMRRLAAELDVATPTIYWHAGSRADLVVEIVRDQSKQLAERPVEGATPRERVLSTALHMYRGAIEQRPITSLAHQTGTTSLLLHDLEAALVAELEAGGLEGQACADALRAILLVLTGALVLALRDQSKLPEDYRPDVLWMGSDDPVMPSTRAALCTDPDLDALTATTLRAAIEHHVPAARANRSSRRTTRSTR